MNDFLTALLVNLWDKFKVKNAKVATIVALVLGTLVYFADQGTLLGIIDLPKWAADALEFLGTFVGFITGARTTADLGRLKSQN